MIISRINDITCLSKEGGYHFLAVQGSLSAYLSVCPILLIWKVWGGLCTQEKLIKLTRNVCYTAILQYIIALCFLDEAIIGQTGHSALATMQTITFPRIGQHGFPVKSLSL